MVLILRTLTGCLWPEGEGEGEGRENGRGRGKGKKNGRIGRMGK